MPANMEDDEDQHSSLEDDVVPSLQVEDDEDEDFNHYTLRLASTITIASEIICLTFSEDGRYLLACCGDGVVRVFNPSTSRLISVLVSKRDNATDHSAMELEIGGETAKQGRRSRRASSILDCVELPCTCASFRPHVKMRGKTSGVAVIGYSRGEFQLWHVPSAKLLHRQAAVDNGERSASHDEEEELYTKKRRVSRQMDDNALDPVDTEVLCCAYACTGQVFALGLSDGVVKVYDDNTKEVEAELKPSIGGRSGHSSRVFSLKFHPDDPNILVSGGWDDCVLVWDVDKASAIRTLYGPHICGDAVDVMGTTILTGSWRDDNQLETWDLETGKLNGPSFWGGQGSASLLQVVGRRCRLFAAAFGGSGRSPGKFIAAGGGNGANEVKVFASGDHSLVGSLLGLTAAAISLAFGDGGRTLAVGLADGQIHLVEIKPTAVESESKTGKTIMVF